MKIFSIWILFSFICLASLIRTQEEDQSTVFTQSEELTTDEQLTSESQSDALNLITIEDDNNLITTSNDENSDGIITSESSTEIEYTSSSNEATDEPKNEPNVEVTTQETVNQNSELTSQQNDSPLTSAVEKIVELTTLYSDENTNSTSDNLILNNESTQAFQETTFQVVNNETDSTNSTNNFQQDDVLTMALNDATTSVESITSNQNTDFTYMPTIDDDNGSGDVEENVTISFNETTSATLFECQDYEFKCDTNKCINMSQKCDTILDCEDGTDEDCTTTTLETTTTTVITTTTTPLPDIVLELQPDVETIEVKEGSDFTISCKVSGKLQNLQAVFYKDQAPLAQSDNGSVEFTIANIKLKDEGDYLCYGYPIDRSNYIVKAVKVNVLTDRPRPRPKPNKESKLIRVGEVDKTIDLTCDYSTSDQVRWRKVNGELSDYSREHNGTLFIYYLKDKDSGEYECYLPDGRSAKVKLNVRDPASPEPVDDYEEADDQYAIRAYVEKSLLEINYGKNDEQVCTGMTNGKSLEIEWYNPRGQLIRNNQNFKIQTEQTNDQTLTKTSKLIILNFNPYNSGTYECRAVIGRQKSIAKFDLQLTYGVTPKPIAQSEVCDIQEATCRNGQCIPRNSLCNGVRDCTDGSDENNCIGTQQSQKCEPNEKKCRNGKCIQKIWFCDGENDCGDNSDEDLCPKLLPGEKCHTNEFLCKSGEQCVLKGFVCDSEKDCVDNSDETGCEQPRIIRGPSRNLSVITGGTIRIECEAAGFPEPFINWRLNWGHVCEEPRCTATSRNGTGVLTIKDARLSDAGAYSCEALNSKGRLFAIPDAIVNVYGSDKRPEQQELCSIEGSLSRYPPCSCKPNFSGYYCNECKDKHFHLSKLKGCVSCFCNGLNVDCKSSHLYYNTIQSSFMRDSEDWSISDISNSLKTFINWNKGSVEFSLFSDYPDQELYFVAPKKFLGNKLTSYGGNLTFTIRFEGSSKDRAKKLNVRLSGYGYNLIYNHSGSVFSGYRDHKILINLNEDNFKQLETDLPISREKFLMTLSNIDKLMIRASFVTQQYAAKLSDVSMSAAEQFSYGSVQHKANAVEVCECPEGYTGTSCESCAVGYKRIKSGYYFGFCEREYQPSKYEVTLKIDVPQNKLSLRPGQTHIIYVTVTGGGTANWYRESDGRLPPGVRQENNNLVIDNAKAEISGNYVCAVYTSTGEIKEIVVIQVNPDQDPIRREPPTIFTSNQKTTKIRLGQPLVIECTANGYPVPSVRIETPDTPASLAVRQPTQTNRARYEISYFTSRNIGEYKCIAENDYNERAVETFFVIQDYEITEPPSIKIEPRILDLTEGSNIILNFTYTGSEPVDVRVQLYGPGQIPQSNLIVDKNAKKIEIRGVTKDMEGQYIITASNAYGSQNDYFQLRVQEAPGPKIFITETVLRTDENTQLKIEPRVQYSGQPSFSWTKDNGPLPATAQINGYILYIPQVRKEHEGVYALTLDDKFGSARIQVRVIVEQKYPTSSRKPSSIRRISVKEDTVIELTQDETVNLLCNLKPKISNPKIFTVTSWFRGSQTQKEKFPSNVRPNQERLQVIKFKPTNAGPYTCTLVSSDGSTQSIVATLVLKNNDDNQISEPPTARLVNKNNNEINVGDNLDISCSISGNPEPQTVWLFNNQPISNMNNVYPARGLLSIRDAQLNLNGYITCRAVGVDGQSADDSMLLVVKENKQDLFYAEVAPQSSSIPAGESTKLTCNLIDQATGNEYKNVRFSWSKNNGQLPASNTQTSNGELQMYNLQEKDTGSYVCQVEDLLTGKTYSSSANLNVLFEIEQAQPLTVSVTAESTNLLQGRDAELECTISGGKNPTIQWKKISSNFDSTRHLLNGNKLLIKNVQLEDRDYFECRAESEDGQIATNYLLIQVEPREAPKLTIRPSDSEIQVALGTVSYAQCHASGIPTPSIEWKRVDGKPLSSKIIITQEGSLLQIQEMGLEEYGRYECVAKNIEGVASEEINFVRSDSEERYETSTPSNEDSSERKRLEEERRRQKEKEEEERKRKEEDDLRQAQEEQQQKQRQPPNIVVQKNFVQVVEGRSATLSCYTTSNQQYRIDWLGPNDEFLESNDGNLLISNTRRGQSGTYKCVIINAFGKNSARIELQVNGNNEKSEELKIQIVPKSKKVTPGGRVEFKCNVNKKDNDPFIQWSRSGHIPFSAYHSINDNVLRIENVQKEDHGRYLCTVTTNDGKIDFDAAFLQVLEADNKFPVYIKVLEKPTEFNPPEYQYGVKITAECVAQSDDIQDISWYKVEGGVNRATYIAESNKNTMKMEALVVMDLGTYVCMATRNDGAKAQNSITFYRSPTHGNRFEIRIEGPSEPVEEPQQEDETDQGTTNEPEVASTKPPTTDSNRLSAPTVKISNQDRIDKNEGESLEISCQVSGNPKPTIEWNKDNIDLKTVHRVVENTLYIEKLEPNDSGYYMCYGENSQGRERAYIYLNVASRPTVDTTTIVQETNQPEKVITTTVVLDSNEENSSPEADKLDNEKEEKSPLVFIKSRSVVSISPGVELILSCYVSKTSDIESESSVKFSKLDSSELDSERVSLTKFPGNDFDRYDLTFAPFDQTDAGEYKCTASNKYGSSSDTAQIEKEMDDSFIFKTENFNSKNGSVENVKLIVRGEVANQNIVEISCQLQAEGQAKYYQWARYENFAKSSEQSNNTLFLNNFNYTDNGIYGCKVTTDDNKEFYGTKLVASNDYLLSDNPYFKFSREHNDYVTVRCRPYFNTQVRWRTPNQQIETKANYKLDGDELHLYQTDNTYNYTCVLPSDNEYGSIMLDLEVNRDLLDKAFEMKLEDNSNDTTDDIQNDTSNVKLDCTPDCLTNPKKPKAKIIPIYIDTQEGGKIDLKCDAEDDNIKSLKWIKDNQILSSNQTIEPTNNGYYECQIESNQGYASDVYFLNKFSIYFKLIDKNSIGRLEILCETDQKANISWHLKDSSQQSFNSIIKGNKLSIKRLKENDLDNFECVADNGYFKMTKKLNLNLLNEYKHNNSNIRLLNEKKANKSAKFLIRLHDLNIETTYSNDQIKLKCHISTDGLSLRLEKYSFNYNLEYQSNVLYDSGYDKVNQTDYVTDSLKNTYLRTYTCLASDILQRKVVTKTKYLMSKNGESFLIRYILTEFCGSPIRIFEFDNNHYENILYKINSDFCFTVDWFDSNEDLIQNGLFFHRSKLPADQIVYLRFNLINSPQKLILKLKSSNLVNINQSVSDINDLIVNQEILTTTKVIKITTIKIQVTTSPGYVKLQCISDLENADYKWVFLNGSFTNNVKIENDLLVIEPFTDENIGIYQCLAYNLKLNLHAIRRVNLNTTQNIFDVSKRIKIDVISNELKRNETIIIECSIDIINMSVYWMKRGAKFSPRAHAEPTSHFRKSILVIRNFQPEDLGIYICKLKPSKPNYIGEKKIYLMASQFSDIDRKEQILFNPDLELKISCNNCNILKPIEISCEIKNFDTTYPEYEIYHLEWKKSDGSKIDHSTKHKIISKSNNQKILKIESFASNYESFSCYAFSSTGTVKQTIEIIKQNLIYQININKSKSKFINLTIESKNTHIEMNHSISFECITDTFELEWFRLNGEFSRNLKIIGNRILINPYINEMDNGTYTCIAYYDDDYSSSASIIIERIKTNEAVETNNLSMKKYLKPIIDLIPNFNKNFHYDSFVKIDCNSLMMHNNESNSIEWIRLQEEMSERTLVKENSLIIQNFQTEDLGKYACIVSNYAGYLIKTIEFYDNHGTVLFKIDEQEHSNNSSQFNKLDKRLNFLIGSFNFNINEPFSIECFDLYGSDEIKPEWKKLNSNATITHLNTPHILYIPKIGLNDAGTYYCQTTDQYGHLDYVGFKLSINKYGQVNLDKFDKADLFQNRSPYVQITIVDKIALSRSESVKFQCLTDKNSRIKWVKLNKNEEEFLNNQSILKLAPITPNDLGTYKCIASNRFGTSSASVTIESSPRNGIFYDSLIYAYIDDKKSTQENKVSHLKHKYSSHDDDAVLSIQNIGSFNFNDSINLKCHTGNWSLKTPFTPNNIVTRENHLEINNLQQENLGSYTCVNHLKSYEIVYLIKQNRKGVVNGRIRSVELINSGTKLDILTPIENLTQYTRFIKLKCSSRKKNNVEWFIDSKRTNTKSNNNILKINKFILNKLYKCNNEIGIEFKPGLISDTFLGEIKLISHKKLYYFIQIKNP